MVNTRGIRDFTVSVKYFKMTWTAASVGVEIKKNYPYPCGRLTVVGHNF